jgi:voltage-gated potassium channel Kch
VLFSFATQQGVLPLDVTMPLVAAVALTMALTPLLMLVNEMLVQPRFGTPERERREPDAIEESSPVIIAGYGRFGSIVGGMLRANGIEATVLDLDSDHVEMLRTLGQKVFYGDASRLDLLRAAGAENARVLVVAVDDPERILAIVEAARKHFPQLQILTRAVGRTHAYELIDAGMEDVYRESFDSSIRVGVDVMRRLGVPAYEAQRRARMFRSHDEQALRELAGMRGDQKAYVHGVRQQTQELERILRSDALDFHPEQDAAWDDESLRREFGATGEG